MAKAAKKDQKWNELTRKERCVELAKDVIKHIGAGNLTVMRGQGYIEPKSQGDGDDDWGMDYQNIKVDKPMTKDTIKLLQSHCTVCARGALLISRVDKFNTLTPLDLGFEKYDSTFYGVSCSDTTDGLQGSFTDQELDDIETAFEFNSCYGKPRKTELLAYFASCFKDDGDRLLAIMQNIVDHKGTFKPEVLYTIEKS